MNYLIPPLIGLIILLLNLVAPLLVLFVLPFIRWDQGMSMPARTHAEMPTPRIQGSLPDWLSWFETPDLRLPGDLQIPEVKAIYDRYGRTWCAWNWMGVRNVLMGMAVYFGRETTDYIPEGTTGFWSRPDGVWRYALRTGPITWITGYNVYLSTSGKFQAAPVFTAKLKR